MEELTAKSFARNKATEIMTLCDDIKYIENKKLRIYGIENIQKLSSEILEHLEYLEVKKSEDKQ